MKKLFSPSFFSSTASRLVRAEQTMHKQQQETQRRTPLVAVSFCYYRNEFKKMNSVSRFFPSLSLAFLLLSLSFAFSCCRSRLHSLVALVCILSSLPRALVSLSLAFSCCLSRLLSLVVSLVCVLFSLLISFFLLYSLSSLFDSIVSLSFDLLLTLYSLSSLFHPLSVFSPLFYLDISATFLSNSSTGTTTAGLSSPDAGSSTESAPLS